MKYAFLPPKSIFPQGWYLRQLQAQADGLNGNLDKVWKDVYDSRWLGGNSEGWERFPYFLDGYIPLAYLLRDEDKIARSKKYIDAILSRQADDGCFYPVGDGKTVGDVWSQFLILKALTVYADCSGDERVEESVLRGLQFLYDYTRYHPPVEWGAARWFECIIPILWIQARRPSERAWLLRFSMRLKAFGLDYESAMPLFLDARAEWTLETHGVNLGMALKSEALYCEMTGEPSTGFAERLLDTLTRYHSTAYGHFTADECLAGDGPTQGCELCSIVETMYSYEWLTALTGQAKWGDRLESLAFNALPATVSADMWTHQYDQQVNQIACVAFEKSPFLTNGPDSNVFGLEPHFGCCTSNFGQGFPKFLLSAYLRAEDGLVIVSPLPASLNLDGYGGVQVQSQYPFRNRFTVCAEKDLPVRLRIPEWATPTCSEASVAKQGWLLFTAPAGKAVEISFAATPRIEARPEGRYCLKYGALLFALSVEGKRTVQEYTRDGVERKFPYCDYQILPVGEWRYAFASKQFTVEERQYDLPFDRSNPAVVVKTELAPVEWSYRDGQTLVASDEAGRVRRGENIELCLQPYGSTDLRIAEMAFVEVKA